MSPLSRRAALHSGACLLAATLAGCSDAISTEPSESDPDDDGPRWDPDDYLTDVAVQTARLEMEQDPHNPVFTYNGDSGPGAEHRLPYVVDDGDVDALQFNYAFDGEDECRTFLAETDYDESTVVIVESSVSGCERLELMYVEIRSSDRLAPQLCRVMRDPSVSCRVDDEHVQVTLVRVPVPYDSPPSGSGRGHSSGCRLPPDHPAHDPHSGERQ